MKCFFTAAFCFFLAVFAFPQQSAVQQAARSASLAGMLIKEGSGEPIRNAEVSLSHNSESGPKIGTGEEEISAANQQITVVTDASGRFRFPRLTPGTYTLLVRKNGFHGFRGPNSRSWQEFLSITLAPGQAIADLALSMQPGSVITGKVLDQDGEPMAYVQVNALKWIYANHQRQLRPIGMATTDDQGNYRIFALEPGRYIMRANAASDTGPQQMRYAPLYFPEAESPSEAAPIALRAGDQLQADFRLTRVRAVTVSGHVGGGTPGAQIQIYLRNVQDEGVVMARTAGASVDRNGNFSLRDVLPGNYVLGALEFRGDDNDNPQHAEMAIQVEGADLGNINLALEDSGKASLQGTLRLDGANVNHPPLDTLRIGFLPADDSPASSEYIGNGGYAKIGKDGSVHLEKVSPGKYMISLTAEGSGWEDFYTKRVQIGGRDVTDSIISFNASHGVVPINILIGIDGASVEGTVTDENNKPVANATVIGVPEPALRSQFDLYQRGESDQNGHFRLRGIKPGSYSFYAWNNMDDESYMDPEFLRRYENVRTDLTLNPKDHPTLALRLLSTDEQ